MEVKGRCGWMSDYATLHSANPDIVVLSMEEFLSETNPSQIAAWRGSVPALQREVGMVIDEEALATRFNALLEYELPREGGRRPDVVMLQNGVVVVVEFKDKAVALSADLDQVSAYARDLKHYHEMSHELSVEPALVLMRYAGPREVLGGVALLKPSDLGRYLIEQSRRRLGPEIDSVQWINAPYAPLPSLLQAARMLFRRQALPRIKRAESAGVYDAAERVIQICGEAAQTHERRLILLTGVPGAGKTLVGLQVAHDDRLELLRNNPGGKGGPAAFLSGNGPLVAVLQDALGSRAFVQGMKKFVDYYGFKRADLRPTEHVLVFDEAQRAWDASQMSLKHGEATSEPEMLLRIAKKIPDWSVVVGLIGEGQEIHKGEEAGIEGWANAVSKAGHDWVVHCPPHLASLFGQAIASRLEIEPTLNLSTTLRSHIAGDLHKWVEFVLTEGAELGNLKRLASELADAGFPIYATRNLSDASDYVRDRYSNNVERRYGLLASRYAKNLRALGIDNTYHFQRVEQLDVAKWYNSEPGDRQSCCALARPATEFDCQGLELDFPIICWGDDLVRNARGWYVDPKRRSSVEDPVRVTMNSYRVLLTRGRDGMCIYVPHTGTASFDSVFAFVTDAGARSLSRTAAPSKA